LRRLEVQGTRRRIFADEAQDLNVMHWKVMRRWDGHGHNFIHAGDDDQASIRLWVPRQM
jgi:superfamily I DNA/RNA helicase